MVTKQCSKCKETKPLSEFHKNKNSKIGVRSDCKACAAKHYQSNKEAIDRRSKRYYENNRDKILEQNKTYYQDNKEAVSERHKRYYYSNKKKRAKQTLEYDRNKRKYDLLYRLASDVRSRVREAFRKNGYTKSSHTYKMLGCTFEELKEHLESQFKDGMLWENRGEWHIDHIVPFASAKTEEELIELCHYTNLQPLWAEENLKKGTKIVSVGNKE